MWRAALLFLLLTAAPASAQTIVRPSAVQSTNLSSTISVTNTFQSVQALNSQRQGCTIQNAGTHTMYVFFGPIASATTSNSFQVGGGGSIACSAQPSGSVLTDQVSITGTSGDAFVANFQ